MRGLDPLPCYCNFQQVGIEIPFLTSNLEARPTPMIVRAGDGDHGKRPYSEGRNHDG
jgi:hypothetical protein